MTVEIFMTMLLTVSIFTSLSVEALKSMLKINEKKVSPNILAAIVSVILSVLVMIAYYVFTECDVTPQFITYGVGLTFLSWLCSQLSYDKVVQAIAQIKGK